MTIATDIENKLEEYRALKCSLTILKNFVMYHGRVSDFFFTNTFESLLQGKIDDATFIMKVTRP